MNISVPILVLLAWLLVWPTMNNAQESAESVPTAVCHEGQTYFIDGAELQAHLDHGDMQGACPSVTDASGTSGDSSENEDGEKPEKVTICHKGKNTLNISQSALQAHLDHGDVEGTCTDSSAKGKGDIESQNKQENPQKPSGKNDDDVDENNSGQGKNNSGKGNQGKGKGKS